MALYGKHGSDRIVYGVKKKQLVFASLIVANVLILASNMESYDKKLEVNTKIVQNPATAGDVAGQRS